VLTEADLYSAGSLALLMGTAKQESNLEYIKQLGNGPALGLFQMEPNTERDIWSNYLIYRGNLQTKINQITNHTFAGPWLEWDIAYQILMCRIHYLRVKEPLPNSNDIQGLAEYWKKYYNTINGKGAVEEFIKNYNRLGACV